MGTLRFRPVELVVNPRHFGRKMDAMFDPNCPLDPMHRGWAVAQHRAALVVHEELDRRHQTYDDMAVRLDVAPSWLRRKLTGQVPADIGDFVAWSADLGIQVWPEFVSVGELLGDTSHQ